MNIDHLIRSAGYPIVFLLVGAESLGIPLPGETILIAAAIYAGQTHHLSPWGIWGVAAAAAIIGDNIGFLVGDQGGYRLLRRYGRYIRVREREVKVGRLIFARHGGKVVFFGRFISVLRTYAAFLAGTLRMQWRRFLPYNAAGGILWSGIYTWVPYEVGHAINRASHTFDIVLGILAVLIIVGTILFVRRKAAQLGDEAEAAFPGPLPEH